MDVHKFLEEIYKVLKKAFSSEEGNKPKGKASKLPNYMISCLAVILVCTLGLLVNNFFKSSTSTVKINSPKNSLEEPISTSAREYEIAEENKLKSVLEQIDGVGNVKIMLTIDGSEEQVPAVNSNDSTSTTNEKDPAGGTRVTTQKTGGSTIVIANDGVKNQPLIVKTNKPKVVGVCVVAEGAKERMIQLQITKAVTSLYNISPDKVSVYAMKK